MDYKAAVEGRVRLTFSEANILKTCMANFSKGDFLYWMEHVLQNTESPALKKEVEALSEKIMRLNEDAYQSLREDVASNAVFFPPNYKLPTE